MRRKEGWIVKVFNHCESCKQLREDVEDRKWNNGKWYFRKEFELTSCKSCFDEKVKFESLEENPYDGYC